MHILHAGPPKQQATVGLTIPSAAREDLINDWSELLCHRWGRSPPQAVIFIPFVLTLEQKVIYKGLSSHEVSPSPFHLFSWAD
ncbi:unnamed protein product [Tetraodon nigroviridis]|uniref:(spotted green pufferfish) hypothetical protein n=1 Tax=Tetraodon nigroviridis TaxID=99883 RepID=Q4SZT2_TETNG|nr:unnamed protein product [Tetraodon nigroviridis]